MAEKEGLFEIDRYDYHAVKGRQVPTGKWRKKDFRDRKTEEYVFDVSTLETLYKFSKKGLLKALGGPISRGKEAVIFHALGAEEEELAIKMYKVSTATFNLMRDYIVGDPRFKNIKKDHRSIIFAWARKEYKNLKRARNAGIRVPKPVAYDKNLLLMEFIGKDEIAAPRLKDIPVEMLKEDFDLDELFHQIISAVKTMYEKGTMVHADLSEFNILMKGYGYDCGYDYGYDIDTEVEIEPVIIDMGQSLLLNHLHAGKFLRRDVRNIVIFFNKRGINYSEDEAMQMVKG